MEHNKLLVALVLLGLPISSLRSQCTGLPDLHTCTVGLPVTCADINNKIGQARDGDTVLIPPNGGTPIVCTGVNQGEGQIVINNKAITLKGQTTTDTSNAASTHAVDNTIIVRQFGSATINNKASLINITTKTPTAGPVLMTRITGITFRETSPVGSKVQNGYMSITGYGVFRVDTCHFQIANAPQPAQGIALSGGAYGVTDHNFFETAGSQVFYSENGNSPNHQNYGNASWSEDAGWGTKGTGNDNIGPGFWFIEDNYLKSTGSNRAVLTDGATGCKFVIRHNHIYNYLVATHGTESHNRGGRAFELYLNDYHNNSVFDPGGMRNGSMYFWGNTWDDNSVALTSGGGNRFALDNYRVGGNTYQPCISETTCGWEGATGRCPWDVNETEGNGTYDEAHHLTPWQYYPSDQRILTPPLHATATPSPAPPAHGALVAWAVAGSQSTTTLVSTQTNGTPETNPVGWTNGKWATFGIFNLTSGRSSILGTGTTATTLPVDDANEKASPNGFGPAIKYQIYRVLVSLDNAGRGKGELMDGGLENVRNLTPLNQQSPNRPILPGQAQQFDYNGQRYWPHEPVDPCYSWSNRWHPGVNGGQNVNLKGGAFTVQADRDYYNEAAPTGSPLKQNSGVGVGTTLPPGGGKIGSDIAHCTPTVTDYNVHGDNWVPGTGFWLSNDTANHAGLANYVTGSDQGVLYAWHGTAANSAPHWEPRYRPYEYPHPCVKNSLVYKQDGSGDPATVAPCTENATITPQIQTTSATFYRGDANLVTLAVTGFSSPPTTWTRSGSLPANVCFNTTANSCGNGNPAGTFEGTANTATLQDYPLTLTASNGAQTSPSTTFTLTVTIHAPDITFSTDKTSATAAETVTLSATVTPHGGATISQVEFFDDTGSGATRIAVAGNPDSSSPYGIATTFAQGTHTLTAVVTEVTGSFSASTVSDPITLIVSGTNPITVSITAPSDGDSIPFASNPITISASASTSTPGATISNVKFLDNGTVINTDTSSPFSYAATLSAGSHTLKAQATDSNSISQTSSPIAITVTSVSGPTPANIQVKP